MPDITVALSQLIAGLRSLTQTATLPLESLGGVAHALDRLNDNPAARAELHEAINHAQAKGIRFIDGVPVFVLRSLLEVTTPEGGRNE